MSAAPVILVTGATGSIGRHVVPALRAAGYAVRGQYVRKPGDDPAIDWRQWNLLEKRDLALLVEGCVGVIHLAAAIHDVPAMERLNVEATRDLASAAARAGIRYFCHASSIVVYGSPRRRDVDEASPTIDLARPIVDQFRAEPYMLEYARTKKMSEEVLHDFTSAMHIDIVRPAVVADEEKFREVLGWSVPRKLLSLHRRTQYIHVKDVAAALVHLSGRGLAQPAGAIDIFNICDAGVGTYRALLVRLAAGGPDRLLANLWTPEVSDLLKDAVKHRSLAKRYPLGLLRLSNARLAATGFRAPIGYAQAVERARRS